MRSIRASIAVVFLTVSVAPALSGQSVEELLGAVRAMPGGAQKLDEVLKRTVTLRSAPAKEAKPAIVGRVVATVPGTVLPYSVRLTPTSPVRPDGAPPRLKFHLAEYDRGRFFLRAYGEWNRGGSGFYPVSQVLFSVSVPHNAYVIAVEGICTDPHMPDANLYRVPPAVLDQIDISPNSPDLTGRLEIWTTATRGQYAAPSRCRFVTAMELDAGVSAFAFMWFGSSMEFLQVSVLAVP